MKKYTIKEALAQASTLKNQEIELSAWIKTVRAQKNICFLNISDGSCFKTMQAVAEDNKLTNFSEISALGSGSAVILKGFLVDGFKNKDSFEFNITQAQVEGTSGCDYPLQPKKHSVEFLRSIAHFRARANLFQAVFRVRSEAAFAIHNFFHERNFIYVHTPIITSSDCEGAGEMFNVTNFNLDNIPKNDQGEVDYKQDFFGKHTSLTVSGQLNAETFAQAFKNVYTFGPTFRAEKSYTARHIAEFWMVEPEIAFANLEDDMKLAGDMLKYVIKTILEKCPDEIKFFNDMLDKDLIQRLQSVVKSDFVKVTYTEAIDILQKSEQKFEFPVTWGCDLQTEHERYLTEVYFKSPVFVIDYPKEIKAFYMRLNDDGKTVAAMDCLVPGIGEIIGGSQREERLELLEQRIKELNLNSDEYSWYLDLRRYGSTHHAGFGLGFERLIMYLTSVNNIRDVIPFPRATGSIEF